MNEAEKSNGNGIGKYLGVIFLLIGVVALVASYYMVNQKYTEKIDTIEDEINSLKGRRDDLKKLDDGKAKVQKLTKVADELCDKIIAEFDGDITYKGVIMDVYNIGQKINQNIPEAEQMSIPRLTFAGVETPYVFGAVTSSNPAGGVGGYDSSFTTTMMKYNFQTVGSYEQMKDTLKAITDFEGKRKGITSITITRDDVTQLLNTNITVDEYVVQGGDRKETMAEIPAYEESKTNIFYDDAALAVNGQ